tara:strand:+ start:4868 stop:5065 length:198 start_codon:yes stop_codon:yes gene_type:complete
MAGNKAKTAVLDNFPNELIYELDSTGVCHVWSVDSYQRLDSEQRDVIKRHLLGSFINTISVMKDN